VLLRLLSLLLRLAGKTYRPAAGLPDGLVLGVLGRRLTWLVRGLLRLRARSFVGPNVILRGANFIRAGRFSTFESACHVDGYSADGVIVGERTKIGAYTIIACTGHLSKLGKGLRIGSDCGISEFSYLGAAGGITIGDNVIMGQYVSMHSENHNFADPTRPIREQGVTSQGISIGSNIWIGAKVTILDGTVIGDNSVVAAGAVVRGVYPPNSILAGVPAKVVRSIHSS
jgi:acetyltransferase-like isoleucine patch superfamily enzyme